ncbi:MAG: amino acid-binding protein [Gammaproteobacteria bacterium]|nr:amino acid-binding protein [Gammaproteobacteria bacterium]
MTNNWHMLTVVGKDKPGIVASISEALFAAGCNFGEASMSRLGGNFTIMLMVQYEGGTERLEKIIAPIAQTLNLRCHINAIEGQLHAHREPDVRISVYGQDRTGIVAHVTGTLARAGLDIYDLESDVGGSGENPVYIMHIEGHAMRGVDALKEALETEKTPGIETHLEEIDTIIG